jgi:hypothetical protein
MPKPFSIFLDELLKTIAYYKEQKGELSRQSREESVITYGYGLTISKELMSKSHLIEVRSLSQDDDLKGRSLRNSFKSAQCQYGKERFGRSWSCKAR